MMNRPGGQQNRSMMPNPHGMVGAPVSKARDFKGTMRKLLSYMSTYRGAVIVVFLFAIASTASNIAGPKILGNATTKVFEGVMAQLNNTGSIDFDYIGRIIGAGRSSARSCPPVAAPSPAGASAITSSPSSVNISAAEPMVACENMSMGPPAAVPGIVSRISIGRSTRETAARPELQASLSVTPLVGVQNCWSAALCIR